MTNDQQLTDDEGRSAILGALQRGEFFLLYQTEFDLSGGRFAGVEALIRWRHGNATYTPPQFFGWLRDTNELVDVGRWALAMACEQGAQWRAMGYRFTVGVNIALEQLFSPGFVVDVTEALDTSRLPASQLTLELPPTCLRDERSVSLLEELRTVGVTLALDNFSPDDASLQRALELPFAILKLDRALTSGTHADGATAVTSVLETAQRQGLRIVASGIEFGEQQERWRGLNVDAGQGFFFSTPVTVEELDSVLEDYALFSGRPL
jgi:EAL domain-containing protein (putative c-di-GMP-specific phosphodiesterase class I)